jgi:hypothetical protein
MLDTYVNCRNNNINVDVNDFITNFFDQKDKDEEFVFSIMLKNKLQSSAVEFSMFDTEENVCNLCKKSKFSKESKYCQQCQKIYNSTMINFK